MNTPKDLALDASLRLPAEQFKRSMVIALAISTVTLSGCSDDADFGLIDFEPTVDYTRSVQLIAVTTELASGLGDVVTHEEAALAIKTTIETELPCASVAVSGATVTVEYGANGSCALHGITLQGTHAMTLKAKEHAPDTGALIIDHAWTNVSDGRTSISGTGWMLRSSTKQFRTVEFFLYADPSSAGDAGRWVFSTTTDPQVLALNGTAAWGENSGTTCTTNDAEIRWGDPAPQVGTYVLSLPDTSGRGGSSDRTILFKRIDDTTIEAKVLGYSNPPDAFHIAQDGTYIRVQ